jgi:hypothetical protein
MSLDLCFYRRHTCVLLRRYFYASMQASRIVSSLDSPVGRGWATSRPIRTFEDAVIFICDMDRCLNQLDSVDRAILTRIVIQDYTQPEAAPLLGMSVRTLCYKLPAATDRLSAKLIDAGILIVAPERQDEAA